MGVESQLIEEIRLERKQKNIWQKKFNVLNSWIKTQNDGRTIKDVLKERNIDSIIIYGTDDIALRFIESCIKEQIRVQAILDENIVMGGYNFGEIPMISIKKLKDFGMKDVPIIVFDENALEKDALLELENVIYIRELFVNY